MRFGPLSHYDLGILKGLLDQHSAKYEITHSPEEFDLIREQRKVAPVVPYPGYHGPERFLYIEIQTKDLLIVRGSLEKMGFAVNREPQALAEVPEYLCLYCKHHSGVPGVCPRHGFDLLEYSDWVAARRDSLPVNSWWWRVVMALVAVGMLWGVTR